MWLVSFPFLLPSGRSIEGTRPGLSVLLWSLSPLLLSRAHGLQEVLGELTSEVLVTLVILTPRVASGLVQRFVLWWQTERPVHLLHLRLVLGLWEVLEVRLESKSVGRFQTIILLPLSTSARGRSVMIVLVLLFAREVMTLRTRLGFLVIERVSGALDLRHWVLLTRRSVVFV